MNFVRFDPVTGKILQIGWMNEEFVLKEIHDGLATIAIDENIVWGEYRVNTATKKIEKIEAEKAENQ